MGFIKMKQYKIDEKYYINVASKMREKKIYPRPRLKRTILANDVEFLQIITLECEV